MFFVYEFDELWADVLAWMPYVLGLVNVLVTVGCIGWVLMIKGDSTSAVAWCLLIFFLPLLGAALFYLLGYQHVERPLRRKRRHKQAYRIAIPHIPGHAAELGGRADPIPN